MVVDVVVDDVPRERAASAGGRESVKMGKVAFKVFVAVAFANVKEKSAAVTLF